MCSCVQNLFLLVNSLWCQSDVKSVITFVKYYIIIIMYSNLL